MNIAPARSNLWFAIEKESETAITVKEGLISIFRPTWANTGSQNESNLVSSLPWAESITVAETELSNITNGQKVFLKIGWQVYFTESGIGTTLFKIVGSDGESNPGGEVGENGTTVQSKFKYYMPVSGECLCEGEVPPAEETSNTAISYVLLADIVKTVDTLDTLIIKQRHVGALLLSSIIVPYGTVTGD